MTSKKFKKSRFSIDEVIANSKFNFVKNLKWFILPSIAIFLVGLILVCVLGFNYGIDFTGGSIMTIYANDENLIADASTFDIENSTDFNEMQNKIEQVLESFDIKGASYQKTTIDIEELGVYHGQAIVVKYQNNVDDVDAITSINSQIQTKLIETFSYGTNQDAILNGGIITPSASTEMVVNAFIAIFVTMLLISLYIGLRFGLTSAFTTALCLFHDILITSSLVAMFRFTVNFTFIASLVVVMMYSTCNLIIVLSRMKEYQRSGRFDGESNEVIANSTIKESMTSLIISAMVALICMLLIGVIGVSDIRAFAFPIVLGILSSFYSTVFLVPGLWSIAFKHKNKKQPVEAQNTEKLQEKAS